jgi:hypothetical protein
MENYEEVQKWPLAGPRIAEFPRGHGQENLDRHKEKGPSAIAPVPLANSPSSRIFSAGFFVETELCTAVVQRRWRGKKGEKSNLGYQAAGVGYSSTPGLPADLPKK